MNPLPNDEETRAMRYVNFCRKDWDDAGIRGALVKAYPLVTDAAELLIVMLEWARCKDSLKPVGVVGYIGQRRQQPATVHDLDTHREPPKDTDPECSECGSRTKRNDGSCHGCWLDSFEDGHRKPRPVSPAPVSRRTGPPPPGLTTAELRAARSKK